MDLADGEAIHVADEASVGASARAQQVHRWPSAVVA